MSPSAPARRSDVAPWLIRPRPDIAAAAAAVAALADGRYVIALQVGGLRRSLGPG